MKSCPTIPASGLRRKSRLRPATQNRLSHRGRGFAAQYAVLSRERRRSRLTCAQRKRQFGRCHTMLQRVRTTETSPSPQSDRLLRLTLPEPCTGAVAFGG